MTKELITLNEFANRNQIDVTDVKALIRKSTIKPLYHIGYGRGRVDYYDTQELTDAVKTSVKEDIKEKSKLLGVESLVRTIAKQDEQIQKLIKTNTAMQEGVFSLVQRTEHMFNRAMEEIATLRKTIKLMVPVNYPMPPFSELTADRPLRDASVLKETLFGQRSSDNLGGRSIPDIRPKLLVIGLEPAEYNKLFSRFCTTLFLIHVPKSEVSEIATRLNNPSIVGIISSVYLEDDSVKEWLLKENHHYIYNELGLVDDFEKQIEQLIPEIYQPLKCQN